MGTGTRSKSYDNSSSGTFLHTTNNATAGPAVSTTVSNLSATANAYSAATKSGSTSGKFSESAAPGAGSADPACRCPGTT